jgi:hypothetical protein
MTERSRQDVLSGFERKKSERGREEPAWRDIAAIADPDGQEFSPGERRDRDDVEVFDSTPIYAVDDFVGGMFGESMNPSERWGELTSGDDDLDKYGPVKKWLWDQMTDLYGTYSPTVCNFYSECTPWLGSTALYGNGFMYQEEWPERRIIIDKAVPIGESYIALDIAGNLCEFDRAFTLTGAQMKQKFGNLAAAAREEQRYTVIHSVCENYDFRQGMLGDRGMRFASTYVCEELRDFRRDKGYYEMPYHPLFWKKRSGRAWAAGPGHNARADMNMNNEIERTNMVAAQFDAEPLMLTHDDAAVSVDDIVPNAVLSGTMSAQGKRLLEYMERKSKPQHAEMKAKERKDAIRTAFLYGVMQILANRPQMTATEFLGLKAEKLKLAGPYLVRIQQGLAGHVARRFAILNRAGQTRPPPPELQGRPLAVKFVSPLAKAQEAATGSGVLQWITSLGQMSTATGDPRYLQSPDPDEVSRVLHNAMVKLPSVIRDQKVIDAERAATAKQVAQQQQIEQASQLASINADVAHANQAQTLSKARGAK